MNLWIGAISQGLIYSFLALGVYLTFRVLDFPDLTVDGSLVTGAAVTAILLIKDVHPLLAVIAAVIAGAIAGMFTGLIHTKLKIVPLISGILMMTALYSINLHILGRSNLPLLKVRTLMHLIPLEEFPWSKDISYLIFFLLLVIIVRFIMIWFIKTDLGLAFRSTGDNSAMITAQGVNIHYTKILGLAISNGLVALSGSLLAQYQGFADVGMGIGMLVAGIAAVVIGETFSHGKKINLMVTCIILGSILFRLLIALALKAGLNPIDLKLTTALFVLFSLCFPLIRNALLQLFRLKKRNRSI